MCFNINEERKAQLRESFNAEYQDRKLDRREEREQILIDYCNDYEVSDDYEEEE